MTGEGMWKRGGVVEMTTQKPRKQVEMLFFCDFFSFHKKTEAKAVFPCNTRHVI